MSHVIDKNGNIKVTTETNFVPLVVTGNVTLDGSYRNVLCDTSGGGFTVTLPVAASGNYEFRIKKISSDVNPLTVDGDGSETIDGALTQVITNQYVTMDIISSSSGWWII